jgi:hypothetical protein
MIPETLNGWTLAVVRDLLAQGYDEGDRFDFKEMLPKDPDGRMRLAKTCAAFANSQGGYLVFGVADAKRPVEQRLTGIDASIDFPVQFGEYPRRCVPSVEWTPRNPPIKLATGGSLPIVEVPASASIPHGVPEQSGAWFFPKRTAKGNEAMTIEEVRAAFLGFYEKRIKLQLLRTELQRIQRKAGLMTPSMYRLTEQPSMMTFDTVVIESILPDTYTLLVRSPDLLNKLGEIRDHCRQVNDAVARMQPFYYQAMANAAAVNNEHNLLVVTAAQNIARLVDEGMPFLDEILK